jgi:hypothetical protein
VAIAQAAPQIPSLLKPIISYRHFDINRNLFQVQLSCFNHGFFQDLSSCFTFLNGCLNNDLIMDASGDLSWYQSSKKLTLTVFKSCQNRQIVLCR